MDYNLSECRKTVVYLPKYVKNPWIIAVGKQKITIKITPADDRFIFLSLIPSG